MVELRKRKEAPAPAAQPPAQKKANSVKSSSSAKANGSSVASSKVAVGDIIDLDSFGGDIEANDGEKTNLMKLVEGSQTGVVLFTYPKASTPGCECRLFRRVYNVYSLSYQGTTQVCLFRDGYTKLTATGLSIYGLSTDSPKSNTTFKTKQNLPYALLCDPAASLIAAIGMKKAPKGTTRGVFVINKEGKVLAAEAGVNIPECHCWYEKGVKALTKYSGPCSDSRGRQKTDW